MWKTPKGNLGQKQHPVSWTSFKMMNILALGLLSLRTVAWITDQIQDFLTSLCFFQSSDLFWCIIEEYAADI